MLLVLDYSIIFVHNLKLNIMKTFRIWHKTSMGIGFEDKRAKSIDKLKLSKWLKQRLLKIEELKN